MPRTMRVSRTMLLITWLGCTACAGSNSPSPETPEPQTQTQTPQPQAEPLPDTTADSPARAEMTAEECEASGGSVVGDIGDGAIHRADYTCPSGAKPSANIRAAEGGPMGVEGSVCCPK